MTRIAIIGVYFGRLPNYFNLWMQSCASNPSIDFKLITDAQVQNPPANLDVIPMTLAEMKVLAERKLNMKLCLETPYKCCDYKPVYGLIFEDYLTSYDFWGHCDLDLVFGDLRGFFDRYHLEQYDKFLPLGHLSLFRNTRACNERFRLTPKVGNDYQHSFSVPQTTQFDELGGINAIYRENGFPFFAERIFADISSQWYRMKLAENYVDSNDKNYPYQVFYWKDGKVFRCYWKHGEGKNEEFLYIHIKKRQYKANTIQPGRAFYINADCFAEIPAGESMNKAVIQRNNPYKGFGYEWLEHKGLFRYMRRLMRRR